MSSHTHSEPNNYNTVQKVISFGYCIGCGACGRTSDNTVTLSNSFTKDSKPILDQTRQIDVDQVCPFTSRLNEDDLADELFPNNQKTNFIGRASHYFVGHVKEPSQIRTSASSGGLTTWIAEKLISNEHIDAVIHVGSNEDDSGNPLFSYCISNSISEIRSRSKSRYYPTNFSLIIDQVRQSNKRYLFIGTPCNVKAIRLLCKQDPLLSERIKLCIAIFCGHMKSTRYTDLLGWQLGAEPGSIRNVDYRCKENTSSANQYRVKIETTGGVIRSSLASRLYGSDWGLGLFKPKACDWCDDVFGETADATLGDAWLPDVIGDPKGNNVLVVRNKIIADVLIEGMNSSALELRPSSADEVITSQRATLLHRSEGLAVRIEHFQSKGIWHPRKRSIQPAQYISFRRRLVYLLRSSISNRSHDIFEEAVRRNSLSYFFLRMTPLEFCYYVLNKSFGRGFLRSCFTKISVLTTLWRTRARRDTHTSA